MEDTILILRERFCDRTVCSDKEQQEPNLEVIDESSGEAVNTLLQTTNEALALAYESYMKCNLSRCFIRYFRRNEAHYKEDSAALAILSQLGGKIQNIYTKHL